MMKRLFIALCFAMPLSLPAQEKWDLRKCVDYAVANNISVKQADVQARTAALQKKFADAQVYPNLSFNTQAGFNFGRSIDPTTNQYTTQKVFFQSYGLQSGATLFNWFNIKNSRAAADVDVKAYSLGIDNARNDISLNVAAGYLQYLLAIEQTNIAKVQIAQTQAQLDNTRKLVDAGSMPELNAAQLEAQLATDSSNYISAKATAEQNKITLMGYLNLDAAAPFEVSVPDVDKIPIEPLSELQADYVYQLAMGNQPLQKFDSLRILSAQYSVKSAKGAMYPTISAFGQLGSNYGSIFREFGGAFPTGKFDTIAVVPVNGTNYYALTPGFKSLFNKPSYFKQVGNINFSQAIGLQLNIPIAGNRRLKDAYQRSQLNVESLKLQQQQDNMTLQKNIYQSYSNAKSAMEKFNATNKSVQTQEYAFSLAEKRYQIGVLSTIDYITAQNNLFTARINQIYARYDFIFKMKLLEFYKGQGLTL